MNRGDCEMLLERAELTIREGVEETVVRHG